MAPRSIAEKIARFSGVSDDAVVILPDIKSVYEVPFNVLNSGVVTILNKFTGVRRTPDMGQWEKLRKLSSCASLAALLMIKQLPWGWWRNMLTIRIPIFQ